MFSRVAEFYRGKRVFLTGHTGFKGAWLALWLRQMGAQVHGYALPAPEGDSLHRLLGEERFSHTYADITDAPALSAALAQAKPQVVLHLAGQSLVRESYREPVNSFNTNVMGTVKLLEALRAHEQLLSVVVVTSDKCYRDTGAPATETDALGGREPYAASKAGAELAAASYRDSFFGGAKIATARGGNVIGGGDFGAERLVPDIIRAVQAGGAVSLRSPQAVRPWQHVLDALYGYLLLGMKLAEDKRHARAYNFAPEQQDMAVGELAAQFTGLLGRGQVRHAPQEGAPYETPALRLDARLARNELGWQPRYGAQQALALSAAWYKQFLENPAGVRPLTLAQLEAYV